MGGQGVSIRGRTLHHWRRSSSPWYGKSCRACDGVAERSTCFRTANRQAAVGSVAHVEDGMQRRGRPAWFRWVCAVCPVVLGKHGCDFGPERPKAKEHHWEEESV